MDAFTRERSNPISVLVVLLNHRYRSDKLLVKEIRAMYLYYCFHTTADYRPIINLIPALAVEYSSNKNQVKSATCEQKFTRYPTPCETGQSVRLFSCLNILLDQRSADIARHPTPCETGLRACDDTGCCCTSYSYAQEGSLEDDCTVTYQYVCAQQILGDNFIDFLCCTTGDDSSFDSCLTDYGDDNVQDQINTCLATTGDQSPQVIAYNNAQEAINNGVDEPDVYEPYAFYDGVWTFCIDDYSVDYFTAILCTMLSPDVTSNIQTCQA
ncbi:hypothetical protein V9T40_010763 [Parthenolecanium corni]|uniref:Uncharacterized protein n=1 Tax=Parthenolecanium corni TaxID=536013 RepID=A0AAN9T453_9HEMI